MIGLPFAFSADEASTIIRMALTKGLLSVPKHLTNLEAREKKNLEVEVDIGVTVQTIDEEVREIYSEEDDTVQAVENLVVNQDRMTISKDGIGSLSKGVFTPGR